MSLFRLQAIANLTADPELRYTPAGTAVLNLRFASDRNYRDKNGEWQTVTHWFEGALWGDVAEAAGKEERYHKGDKVYLEGEPSARAYLSKDKEGVEKPAGRIEIKIDRITMLKRKTETKGDFQAAESGDVF